MWLSVFSSCVFFGVYVRISLKSWEFFCQTVGGLGRSRVRGFLGCLTIWGSFGGACQVFVSFVTVSKLACT